MLKLPMVFRKDLVLQWTLYRVYIYNPKNNHTKKIWIIKKKKNFKYSKDSQPDSILYTGENKQAIIYECIPRRCSLHNVAEMACSPGLPMQFSCIFFPIHKHQQPRNTSTLTIEARTTNLLEKHRSRRNETTQLGTVRLLRISIIKCVNVFKKVESSRFAYVYINLIVRVAIPRISLYI